jgi:hypothetical protein
VGGRSVGKEARGSDYYYLPAKPSDQVKVEDREPANLGRWEAPEGWHSARSLLASLSCLGRRTSIISSGYSGEKLLRLGWFTALSALQMSIFDPCFFSVTCPILHCHLDPNARFQGLTPLMRDFKD